jgi:hypothetical protein
MSPLVLSYEQLLALQDLLQKTLAESPAATFSSLLQAVERAHLEHVTAEQWILLQARLLALQQVLAMFQPLPPTANVLAFTLHNVAFFLPNPSPRQREAFTAFTAHLTQAGQEVVASSLLQHLRILEKEVESLRAVPPPLSPFLGRLDEEVQEAHAILDRLQLPPGTLPVRLEVIRPHLERNL